MSKSLLQTNRKWDVFISYSRADNNSISVNSKGKEVGIVEAFVNRLAERHLSITGNRLNLFFDQTSIENDELWDSKLREGVRDAALFLAFLSPNYLNSEFCIREWKEYLRFQIANARGDKGIKQIYVVTIDELEAKDDPDLEHQNFEFIKYMRSLQRNAEVDIRHLADEPEALSKALALLDTQERLEELKEGLEYLLTFQNLQTPYPIVCKGF